MGIIFKARNNRKKWAAVVMPSSNGTEIPVEILEAATNQYIQDHVRILNESISLFLKSKNQETRKSRYKLACEHYGALSRIRPFTDHKQKAIVNKAIDDFVKADDLYHHPDRTSAYHAENQRKKNKEEFWEGVAQEEFFVDFMEDLFDK